MAAIKPISSSLLADSEPAAGTEADLARRLHYYMALQREVEERIEELPDEPLQPWPGAHVIVDDRQA